MHDDPGGIRPYVSVLLAAAVIGIALVIYIAGYRDEIMAILNQSPT